ncbi:MAG: MaoC family dehydratase N-terminal domain-containing protein, partial [Chloroflexota bacterium]
MEAEVKQGTEARITREMVDELLAVKGKEYPTKGQWNNEATRDSIRHWVEGIGDTNPLYVDEAYAKKTRFGGITAPFSFLLSCEGRSGRVGMPGIHALHAGVRFINHKPIRAGDTITASGGLHDLVEKKTSSFAGRTFVQTWFKNFRSQKGELISTLYDFAVRSERKTASDKGKYHDVTKHKWTDAELQEISKGIGAEEVRGATPRYWEDVNVGDELRPV